MNEKDKVSKEGVPAVFRRFAAYVAVCIVALFVLDTLYRLDSLIKAFASYDLIVAVSAMFLILSAVGAGIAIVGAGVVSLAVPLRSRLLAAVRAFALVFIVLLVSRAACHWLLKIAGWETWVLGQWATSMLGVPVSPALVLTSYYLAVAVAALVWLVKSKRARALSMEFEAVSSRQLALMPIVATLALMVVGFHLFNDERAKAAPICASESPSSLPGTAGKNVGDELPDIVLVTFDAMTARDTSLYGYRLPTTPNMERLAGESYVYDHATSVSNWTKPGTVSILTGKYPHRHRLFSTLSDAVALRHPERTLPYRLRDMGYKTTAVVSNTSFAHPFVNGTYRSFDVCAWDVFAPGFIDGNPIRRLRFEVRKKIGTTLLDHDIYVSGWLDDLLNSFAALRFWQRDISWNDKPNVSTERTFDQAREALMRAKGQPSFVWVHIFAPHLPYLPNDKHRGRFLPGDDFLTLSSQAHIDGVYPEDRQAEVDRLRLRYDEYILEADHGLGEFVDFLKRNARWDNTLMVVSADHGESFEDGVSGHRGEYLYEQMIHIPLMMHLPGQREGRRIGGSASQVDIAPTILHHLKQPVPRWMDGEPLAPYSTKDRNPYRYSMEIEANGFRPPFRRGAVTATDGEYKLIYSLTRNSVELFDLRADPNESNNIAGRNPELAARMRAAATKELGEQSAMESDQ